MNNLPSNNTFVFSPPIDSRYLIELYAGDYAMIEETFADVSHEYDGFVERIVSSFRENDRPALKSAVHKIKPLFGFVGLTGLEALCTQFENACLNADGSQLGESFSALERQLIEAKLIIQSEWTRLAAFNKI